MAGQATPEQEAAAKAEADRVEAEKKAADEKATADAATAAKTPAKPKGYTVTGPAVVLRTDDGAERYLYRGAPVDDSAFSKDSIKHAVSVGLIEKAK